MRTYRIGGRLAVAFACFSLGLPLAAAAQAQSGAASLAWNRFSAVNTGWSAEWSAAGDLAESLRGLSVPAAGDPATIAMSFISANSAVLGIGGGAEGLQLAHRVFDGSDTHISYRQTLGGLPVFNGFVDVHVNDKGQIYLVNNTALSEAAANSLSLQPALAAASAAQIAEARQGIFYDKRGLPYTLTLKPVGKPELGIQNTDGGARLAYRVDLGAAAYVIDANTGALLDTIDYVHSVNGTGTIFDPNPVNTLNNATLRDQADANYVALRGAYYTDKVLLAITKTGTGAATRYSLVGPFVRTINASAALLGSCGVAAAHVVAKPPALSTNGKFAFNRSQANFEHVMAYFHLDRSARYVHSLGFSTLWNVPIRVDAHGITDDNSFYCPRPSGAGYLTFGDGGVDDAEEADVVLHEFGHAIQDASSPGRFPAGGQAGAIGEGFGDYWAFSQKPAGTYGPCFAEWDGQGTCLRRLDKNKKYPANYVGEVHADGEIWSRGLRDLFRKIGKTKADRIILKSHYLVPAGLTFSKGLTALLDADHALFADAHKHDICSVFVERGISAPACGYWVHITWNKLGTDVDLHITPPAPLQEVYYSNRHPNWGDQSTDEDDPTLYQDCITTCTSEEITVASLPTPGTYKIHTYYYSDHGKGATTVSMEVFRGATRLFNGSHTLGATGQDWFAFNIVVQPPVAGKESEPRIVEVNQVVRTARPSGPKKAE